MASKFGGVPVEEERPSGGSKFGGVSVEAEAPASPVDPRIERLRKIARSTLPQDPGAGQLYSDSFTLGLRKPVAGLATGLSNLLTGRSTFGEGYSAGTGSYQDMLDEASKNAGWGGTAAGVAGSLTAGGPARGVIAEAAPVIRQAIGLGAVEGAARNSEDLGSAAKGAAGGAAVAGLTSAAVKGVTSVPGVLPGSSARRAAEREAARGTPPDELKQAARSLYKQLDEAGVAYDFHQASDFADNAISDLKQNQWSPEGVHAPLNGIIRQIDELRGQPMSLEKLQSIREQLTAEAGSIEPQVRRIAGRLLGSIDGFVRQVDPALSSIPRDQIGPMWGEARRLWRSANTAADIGWRVGKAEGRGARTNSGTNIDNPIRQNIGAVMDRAEQPGRFNPYNQAEIDQMKVVSEGTPIRNFLRSHGNRFGGSGPLAGVQGTSIGSAAGLLSAFSGQEPTTSALLGIGAAGGLWGTGKLAKMASDRATQNEADALMRLITTGSLEAAPQVAGPPTRANLAKLLREQQLARGVGVAAGSGATR